MSAPGAAALSAGARLHWYEIYSVLGHGGFGVTYSGWDTNLNQAVAIKEYMPSTLATRGVDGVVRAADASSDTGFVWGLRRFIEEARTLARLRHPSVVRVLSVFEGNGTAYMVMEHERGVDVNAAVNLSLLDEESTVLFVLHALLDGLEYVHAQGFVHRDIKPANILIRDDGSAVLIDFGSARRTVTIGKSAQQLTTIVSRGYAPFEQYDGAGDGLKQGPWTDIYALAATIYRVVTGEPPVDAVTRGMAHIEGRADPLGRPVPRPGTGYSDKLLAALQVALGFRPGDRPQNVDQWRALLPAPPQGLQSRQTTHQPSELLPAGALKGWLSGVKAVASEASVAPGPIEHLRHLRVLVVDDEVHVRNMSCRVLQSLGVDDLHTASDGHEALEQLDGAAARAHIVVLDLDMPRMDGLELIRHLGARRDPPAVILLGGGDRRLLNAAESLARSHDLYLLGSLTRPLKPRAVADLLSCLDTDRTAQSGGRIEVLSQDELLEGMQNDALRVLYQPKVAIAKRVVVGVEALARWEHPTKGLLGPPSFIPVAAQAGHMQTLTDQVFRRAMAQAGQWYAQGVAFGIAVNFSVDDLNRLDLPEYIVGLAQAEGVDPAAVTLEVTESRVMRDFRVPLEVLARLRLRGVGLSIDDFGTGYSSVERIRNIPFTEMKVDRAFVYGASADPAARTILESSIALGRSLGLTLVAEGVETQEDWDLVQRLGCDHVQGYFVSRPMAGDEVLDWVRTWQRA